MSVLTYIINTHNPTLIDHMVTLLKLKIDPIDCKRIIFFFLAVFDRIIFRQKISTWHFFFFSVRHSMMKRPQICIYGISREHRGLGLCLKEGCKDVCMEVLFFFSSRCMSQEYIFKKNSGVWIQDFIFLAVLKTKISLT